METNVIHVSYREPSLKTSLYVSHLRSKYAGTSLGVMDNGGWASPKTPIADWGTVLDPVIGVLDDFLGLEYDAVAWATYLDKGQRTGPHNHHQADWAVVWHLTDGGDLWLEEPDAWFEAIAGNITIFKGTVMHWTEPSPIDGRVSVAINVHLK